MSHPSVATLDARSVPRRLMAGNSLVEAALPVGTRVVYPRTPLPALRDPIGALRQALDEPLGSEPFSTRLAQGMRLAIIVEALYFNTPAQLYWLNKTLKEVLAISGQRKVAQCTVLVGTGTHRRLFPDENKLLLRGLKQDARTRVVECDPEGPSPFLEVARTTSGHPLRLHPAAVEADLVVTLAVSSYPEGGGHTALALGAGGYGNQRAVSTSDDPERTLATIGETIEANRAVFSVELVLDNRHLLPQPESLWANEDDLTSAQRVQLAGLSHLPKRAAFRLASDLPNAAGLIGVYCGSTPRVLAAARARYLEQHAVPLSHQADVLVTGLPEFGPFNTRAPLNPVLIKHLLEAWILRLYSGQSPLRPGGTVILLHPCTNRFDHEQHTAHNNFFTSVGSQGAATPQSDLEAEFARNPALLTTFRTGHAYHPTHAFCLWRQASRRASSLGKVIVVGADNESVPRLLGYETASSVPEALYRAGNAQQTPLDILCLHNPLPVVCQLPERQS